MAEQSASPKKVWLVPAVVISVALLLIGLTLGQGTSSSEESQATGQAQSDQPEPEREGPDLRDQERRDADDPLATGPVDAPVTLIVYSDYQCPYCAKWNHDTLPRLLPFVQRGELRIEWRELNAFGMPSRRAASAAYAAGLQDKHDEYHGTLFADGEKRPASELTEKGLVKLAEQVGLDVPRFTRDMKAQSTAKAVQRNETEARQIGVTGTPTFILDGRPIVGAQPTEVFVGMVKSAVDGAED